MPLFEVAIIEKPTIKEIEELGKSERLVYGPQAVIATDAQGAALRPALAGGKEAEGGDQQEAMEQGVCRHGGSVSVWVVSDRRRVTGGNCALRVLSAQYPGMRFLQRQGMGAGGAPRRKGEAASQSRQNSRVRKRQPAGVFTRVST